MEHLKVPYSRRCCFCIPLRKGLLTWGYLKLAFLLTCHVAYLVSTIVSFMFFSGRYDGLVYIMVGSIVLYLVIETAFTVILVIGSHVKHRQMLRSYGIFSVVNDIFLVGVFVTVVMLTIEEEMQRPGTDANTVILAIYFLVFMYIMFNIYITVLVRYEVTKLQDIKKKNAFLFKAADIETMPKIPA